MRSKTLTLFGCTEDISCEEASTHARSLEEAPYVSTLCEHCRILLCDDCAQRLCKHSATTQYTDGGTIPMSLSNDHYYGHVNRFMVENEVTWLECAAPCMVWSTILVYYLESRTDI